MFRPGHRPIAPRRPDIWQPGKPSKVAFGAVPRLQGKGNLKLQHWVDGWMGGWVVDATERHFLGFKR
jgi:hypothetical protein